MSYIKAETIKMLREKKSYTQRKLADMILVSDKAVSKWETGKGLPDITLIEPLAAALSVSVAELISGNCAENRNRSANMKRSCFYICPVCSNVIHSLGEGSFSCCGVPLPSLTAEAEDDEHIIKIERIENELFISLDHPMTKEHYISFICVLSDDRSQFIKLYPEQNAEARFSLRGGIVYAYCNRHGLYMKRI